MSNSTNYLWLNYTLRAAYHNKMVLDSMTQRLEPDMLLSGSVGGSRAQRLIYGALYDHYVKHHEVMGREQMRIQLFGLAQELDAREGPLAQQIIRELQEVWAEMRQPLEADFTTKKPLEFINYLYNEVVVKPKIEAKANEVLMSGKYDELSREISASTAKLSSSRQTCDPLNLGQTTEYRRLPCGEPWLNAITCGGWRAGNVYGIIAPTGGGKTTCARQASFAAAVQGFRTAAIYTEQSMQEREMVASFWSLVTGKPINDFLAYDSVDDFPEGMINESHQEIAASMSKFMQVYDFSIEAGSMEEVRSIALGTTGNEKPDIVFLDWAGQMAKDLMSVNDSLKGDEATALRYVGDELAQIAREADIPIVVFHQLAPNAGTNPMRKYDHTMASNSKQFFFNIAFGIVICPKDKNNVTRAVMTKGRYNGNPEVIIRLDGHLSKFTPLEGYTRGRTSYERAGKSSAMPTTSKAQTTEEAAANKGIDPDDLFA